MTTEGIHKFLRAVFYLRKVPDEKKNFTGDVGFPSPQLL
jgi:hypothetical protein